MFIVLKTLFDIITSTINAVDFICELAIDSLIKIIVNLQKAPVYSTLVHYMLGVVLS